jgi:hypothetical protein
MKVMAQDFSSETRSMNSVMLIHRQGAETEEGAQRLTEGLV